MPCWTCVANGNMYMAYDSVDENAEGRAVERRARVTETRCFVGGSGSDVVARLRSFAAPSVSLSRTSAGDRTSRSDRGAVTGDHDEASGECHSRFARILRGEPIDLGRDCGSGSLGVFDEDATPWVSEWQLHAPFTSNTALIVCTPPSLNRSTRFSFPTAFASRASAAI